LYPCLGQPLQQRVRRLDEEVGIERVEALLGPADDLLAQLFDASLQDDLPEESRASAFGRSESTLQLAWVLGGALGVLLYTDLANPTSNSIYQRIGYRAVEDRVVLAFSGH